MSESIDEIPEDWFEEHSGQSRVVDYNKVGDLIAAVKTVLETFEKDEAQGFRSRDRQYAITILRAALPRS